MKIKKRYLLFAFLIVVFIIFQLVKFDFVVIAKEKTFGLQIVLGLVDYFMYFVFIIIFLYALILGLITYKERKAKSFVPLLTWLIVLIMFFIFPSSNLYTNLDYSINKNNRIKTIEMLKNNELGSYAISSGEYKAPFRQTSYTRTIETQERNGSLKVLFYIYKDFFKSKVIVYCSDDSGVLEDDFNYGFREYNNLYTDIKKLSPNWYSTTIKN